MHSCCTSHTTRYDTIRYIYVRSKAGQLNLAYGTCIRKIRKKLKQKASSSYSRYAVTGFSGWTVDGGAKRSDCKYVTKLAYWCRCGNPTGEMDATHLVLRVTSLDPVSESNQWHLYWLPAASAHLNARTGLVIGVVVYISVCMSQCLPLCGRRLLELAADHTTRDRCQYSQVYCPAGQV